MRTGLLCLALLVLSACAQPVAPDLRGTITRARLDTVTTPLLLAEIPAQAAQATLIPWGENVGENVGQNVGVVTWRTGDNVSLAFAAGVIVATRGLGDDLMSADVTGTVQALTTGGVGTGGVGTGAAAQYPRHHSYLDGENQTIFRSFLCQMGAAVPEQINSFGLLRDVSRRVETCYSLEETIENTYWTGSDGTLWRSRQWLGPRLGYMTTERLVL